MLNSWQLRSSPSWETVLGRKEVCVFTRRLKMLLSPPQPEYTDLGTKGWNQRVALLTKYITIPTQNFCSPSQRLWALLIWKSQLSGVSASTKGHRNGSIELLGEKATLDSLCHSINRERGSNPTGWNDSAYQGEIRVLLSVLLSNGSKEDYIWDVKDPLEAATVKVNGKL